MHETPPGRLCQLSISKFKSISGERPHRSHTSRTRGWPLLSKKKITTTGIPLTPRATQNDAMEFTNLLLAECTRGMQAEGDTKYLTPAPSACVSGALRGLGVGVTTHSQGHTCGHSGQSTVLEQGIRLGAKGITNVESALLAWGRASRMAGTNPYRCPECQQHMNASEQQVVNELPDTVVLNVLRMGTFLTPDMPVTDRRVITTKCRPHSTSP